MAPSYMYVYPHICNHFSWLRTWCWSVWKSTRGDKCRSYMELVGRCTRFFPLCKYLVHQYIFERPPAYIHCHPILYGWTSLGKKEPTFHMRWLCLFVFLLHLLYGWISFQARKKESTHVFIGEGTPAQAFSTFCSSTQSTDGWSDTRAFILTWTQNPPTVTAG